MRLSPRLLLLVGLVAAGLAACSGSSDADVTVRMLDNSFDPLVVEIEPGQSVEFVNVGLAPHNAIAADESWSTEDSFGELAMLADDSTVLTFTEEGSYDFFCSFHATQDEDGNWQGMTGTLVVGDVDAGGDDGDGEAVEVPTEWTGTTRNVPAEYPTIQAGVDAAEPGDLVLIGPGVYKETVTVTTPGLTLRGTDRNEVILDGEFTLENGIFVLADGVAVENMTARSYTTNGFFWNGVTGYRGSYLTAIDNRVYGIYPFDSVDGLLEYSYASGSEDGGYYIGQCDPCRAVLTNSVAERNGMAYSGTNSSGDIYIVNNVFRDNQSGIVPNTLDSELFPPVHEVYVGGNLIMDTGQPIEEVPFNNVAWAPRGTGIVLFGSVGSVVEKNTIVNSLSSGVAAFSMIDDNIWPSRDNVIRDNVVVGSGRADVALAGPGASGSCVEGENGDRIIPFVARWTADCDGWVAPMPYGLAGSSEALGRFVEFALDAVESIPHGDAADPELTFDNLPADAPVVPAVDVFDSYGFDPETVTAPAIPDGTVENDPHFVVLGIDMTTGFWPVTAGVILWIVPVLTYVLAGLWALMRAWGREASVAEKLVWTILIIGLPVVGIFLFALFGNRDTPAANRWIGVGTSVVLWIGAVLWLFWPLITR